MIVNASRLSWPFHNSTRRHRKHTHHSAFMQDDIIVVVLLTLQTFPVVSFQILLCGLSKLSAFDQPYHEPKHTSAVFSMAAPGSHSSLLGIFIIFPDKELIDDHLVLGRIQRENKAIVLNAPNDREVHTMYSTEECQGLQKYKRQVVQICQICTCLSKNPSLTKKSTRRRYHMVSFQCPVFAAWTKTP